ncbi:MAG: subclass B3 metallo-beta-lactamase [Novosphingobium sp.]|nr:subclass B3 metallo-beta-lactamase [Novosphingobium sp.]
MPICPKPLLASLLAGLTLPACSASLAENPSPTARGAAQWTSTCKDWDEWNKPGPPYRIYGNTWYVGTCGISAILIESDAGHVLIDTGPQDAVEAVLSNVRKIGLDPKDIRVLLVSHEHHDHIGGAAQVLHETGARLLATEVQAAALLRGNVADDDPQHGIHPDMQPVGASTVIDEGSPVELGDLRLTLIPTPGHTSGAASWQWQSCEEKDCRTVVYADSLTPVSSDSYRFSDHPDYVAAFRKGIERVAGLQCDILLTPHPSASKMRDRLATGSLAGGMRCSDYAKGVEARLDARLAEERVK